MSAILIAPPASEPLALDETKLFLRLDGAAEDDLVATLIASARGHVEAVSGRALISQGWRFLRDGWPARRIVRLPKPPTLSVDAVTVHDGEGNAQVVAPAAYTLDRACAPARLAVSDAAPAPGLAVGGIEIDVTAGYGATPADVPPPLRLAMLRLVAHWYERREAGLEAAVAMGAPASVTALLVPYRVLSLGAPS